MTRRSFVNGVLAAVPLSIGDRLHQLAKRTTSTRTVLKSPKAASEGIVTPMVRITAPAPSVAQIQVLPGQFGITSIVKTGTSVTVAWANGVPPFHVEHSTLKVLFTPIGPLTFGRSVTIQDTAGMDTFRVRSYAGDPTASIVSDHAHLKWEVPTP